MKSLSYECEIKKARDISSLHEEEIRALREETKNSAEEFGSVFVVLDDDPTGIQTVHDVAVYTTWEEETLINALKREKRMFYILTNSRGLTADKSEKLHRDLMENLISASVKTGQKLSVISRSDSTLRGHYPLETDIIAQCLNTGLGTGTDGIILAPFFAAGGRITLENVHYVRYGDKLVPAAQTEFAKDETFGYKNSDLPGYIEEKTGGRWKKEQIINISLDSLRSGDVTGIYEKLMMAENGTPIVVNAIEPIDLEVFSAALYRALKSGKNYVYRTAADFVKAVGAISDKSLIQGSDIGVTSARGGIIMIGSHTAKTTAQLEKLRELKELEFIEYDSDRVLDDTLDEETKRVAAIADEFIEKGKTPVIYTKRKLLTVPGDTREEALLRSVKISDAFTGVVSMLNSTPSFIIGKGGITSSDIGTKALQVKRVVAAGQIQPGVPVWKTGDESRFPGIPYVIFPGNVGDDETLLRAVEALRK